MATLYEALLAVYKDIELQNVEGGSDELSLMVQEALESADLMAETLALGRGYGE